MTQIFKTLTMIFLIIATTPLWASEFEAPSLNETIVQQKFTREDLLNPYNIIHSKLEDFPDGFQEKIKNMYWIFNKLMQYNANDIHLCNFIEKLKTDDEKAFGYICALLCFDDLYYFSAEDALVELNSGSYINHLYHIAQATYLNVKLKGNDRKRAALLLGSKTLFQEQYLKESFDALLNIASDSKVHPETRFDIVYLMITRSGSNPTDLRYNLRLEHKEEIRKIAADFCLNYQELDSFRSIFPNSLEERFLSLLYHYRLKFVDLLAGNFLSDIEKSIEICELMATSENPEKEFHRQDGTILYSFTDLQKPGFYKAQAAEKATKLNLNSLYDRPSAAYEERTKQYNECRDLVSGICRSVMLDTTVDINHKGDVLKSWLNFDLSKEGKNKEEIFQITKNLVINSLLGEKERINLAKECVRCGNYYGFLLYKQYKQPEDLVSLKFFESVKEVEESFPENERAKK